MKHITLTEKIAFRASLLLLSGILILLALPGCSAQQVERAESAAARAEQVLEQAKAVVQIAQQAVSAAKQIGNAEAMDKAQQALDVANAALPGLQATATAAKETAAAAKQASEAGGSWISAAIAIVGTLIPAAGILAASVQKTIAATQALRQTVTGLDQARKELGEDQWKGKVAPALASAQDEKVKARIVTIQKA